MLICTSSYIPAFQFANCSEMAAVIKSIATEMETAYFSIIIEAALKMANISQSKLFIVHDSSDGLRHLCGDQDLINCFQSGDLIPQSSDELLNFKGPWEDHSDGSVSESGLFMSAEDDSGYLREKSGHGKRSGMKRRSSLMRRDYVASETQKRRRLSKAEPEDAEIKPVLTLTENDFDDDDDDLDDVDNDPLDSDFEIGKSPSSAAAGNDEPSRRKSSTSKSSSLVFTKASHADFNTKRRCKLCPAECRNTFTLNAYGRHKASVHDRKVVCTLCNKGFATQWALDRHSRGSGCKKTQQVIENTISDISETVSETISADP